MTENAQPVEPSEQAPTRFSSAMPIIILTRPAGSNEDWQEMDRGPGYFNVPAGLEIRVRAKGINDAEFADLVNDLQSVEVLRFLDLSENRNVTNQGIEKIKALKNLVGLNLSSVSVTSQGLEALRGLSHLEFLNLSYCNRLTDAALKILESMRGLEFIDLQGCPGITNGGLARIRRRNLKINR